MYGNEILVLLMWFVLSAVLFASTNLIREVCKKHWYLTNCCIDHPLLPHCIKCWSFWLESCSPDSCVHMDEAVMHIQQGKAFWLALWAQGWQPCRIICSVLWNVFKGLEFRQLLLEWPNGCVNEIKVVENMSMNRISTLGLLVIEAQLACAVGPTLTLWMFSCQNHIHWIPCSPGMLWCIPGT